MIEVALTNGGTYLTASLYSNGAGQNAIFLYHLLNKCEGIKAYFITEEKEGEYKLQKRKKVNTTLPHGQTLEYRPKI
jgi:hypothetical protein